MSERRPRILGQSRHYAYAAHLRRKCIGNKVETQRDTAGEGDWYEIIFYKQRRAPIYVRGRSCHAFSWQCHVIMPTLQTLSIIFSHHKPLITVKDRESNPSFLNTETPSREWEATKNKVT